MGLRSASSESVVRAGVVGTSGAAVVVLACVTAGAGGAAAGARAAEALELAVGAASWDMSLVLVRSGSSTCCCIARLL